MSVEIVGKLIEQAFQDGICSVCVYIHGCKRKVHPQYDEELKVMVAKCEYYIRRPSDEELCELYPRTSN